MIVKYRSAVFIATCLLATATTGCAPGATQNTSQEGSALSSGAKSERIMCMWNAHGKRQYTCSTEDMKSAQEKCDKKASEDRGDRSTCSCTSDPNYIQNMCDDGAEPPVTSGNTRRD